MRSIAIISMAFAAAVIVGCTARAAKHDTAAGGKKCAGCVQAMKADAWCDGCQKGFVGGEKVKCKSCFEGKTGKSTWCKGCKKGYVANKATKCKSCFEGKTGKTTWCDGCRKGFVGKKSTKCKDCYQAMQGGPACKSCSK